MLKTSPELTRDLGEVLVTADWCGTKEAALSEVINSIASTMDAL
jgi:hypothetical protein